MEEPADSTKKESPIQALFNGLDDDNPTTKLKFARFRTTHTLYILLFVFLAILQGIAVAFFTRGFLLSRKVLDNVATLDQAPLFSSGKFNKTVVLVVDALRFDFVIPVDPKSENYDAYFHNNLKALYEQQGNSVLLKFIADPPTTTLQRLKGLTTGSLPTFIDAGSNFNGDVIDEDNLIKQLYLHNKTIYFAGDDTWDALFHPYLAKQSVPYESLNVWDLDTVDNGVISFFNEHLIHKSSDASEWDVLIGHMLGIDHVGHTYGPSHQSMTEKQHQVDGFIREIIDAIDDETLLVVFGDHGMDHTGNHGGASPDEVESTLWLYTKRKDAWKLMDEQVYDTSNLGSNYRQVNQIDFVPTMALLLGLPIPFNNLGWPIAEVATSSEEWEYYSRSTLKQLKRYKDTNNAITNPESNRLLSELWKNATLSVEAGSLYQDTLLNSYKYLWARFDFNSIYSGIILLILFLGILVTVTKIIPSIVVGQMVSEFVHTTFVMTLVSNVCFFGIFYVFKQPAFLDNWVWCSLFATSIGTIIGFFVPIFDRYNLTWLALRLVEELSDYWSRIAVTLMILHASIFASNSFTIWEDKITSFLLITLGMLTLYEFVFLPKRKSNVVNAATALVEKQDLEFVTSTAPNNPEPLPLSKLARMIGGYHSIVLIVCTRLTSLITICREEQGEFCTPTFTSQNNYSLWALMCCFFITFALPSCIKGYYDISSSYQAAAPLWIGILLKSVLFANFIYWTLTAFEGTLTAKELNPTYFKLTISRIITGASLLAANFGWMMGPLCIRLNVSTTAQKQQKATILGYSNAYGAQYFLLVTNFIMCIMLFNKPLAQISLFLMCNQLLSLLEIFDLLKLKENIIGPVAIGILTYQQFFSTGHQATIPAVQWDMGFILTKRIRFPFTHLGIIFNTFGPHIIAAVSIALLTLWKQPPGILKANTLLARIASNCGMLLLYHTLLCLSNLIWVTHFRRHLMVWKIFCPRFIFAALSLIVTQLTVTGITLAFAGGRLIRQINNLFWK